MATELSTAILVVEIRRPLAMGPTCWAGPLMGPLAMGPTRFGRRLAMGPTRFGRRLCPFNG